jgi:hypothetical protein
MELTIKGTTEEIRAQICELAEMFRDYKAAVDVAQRPTTLVLEIDEEGIRTVADGASVEVRATIAATWYGVLRNPCMDLVDAGRASLIFVERMVTARKRELHAAGWDAVELRGREHDGDAFVVRFVDLKCSD